jgi:competence protein ComEC
MPTGVGLGLGAFAAAWAVSGAGFAVTLVLAGTAAVSLLAVVASQQSPRTGGRAASRPAAVARPLAAVALGAWLVVGRLLLGGDGGPAPPSALPEGSGPWIGRVVAVGTPREGQQRLTVALAEPSGLLLAVTAPRYPAVEPGDRVGLAGVPAPPPEGDYGDYLTRIGVSGTLRSRTLEHVGRDGGAWALLERTRRAAGDALARALPEPAAGLAAGILVGLRDRVDRDLAAAFTATGLSHVVAISGWNIAIVAGLVGALLAGRARRTRSGAILLAIVGYSALAGASSSVVRAAAMAGVALLARESGRPGTAATALGWAVTLLVLAAPAYAADVGLQLSAAATAGLVAWSNPLAAVFGRRTRWLPAWVRECFAVSLAAQAATLPIVLLAFGRLSPLAPLTNLAVVPLVPPAMAAGTLALAGGAVESLGTGPVVAALAGLPAALLLGLIVLIVRLAADLPLASIALAPPAAAGLAALVTAGLLALAARSRLATLAAGLRREGQSRFRDRLHGAYPVPSGSSLGVSVGGPKPGSGGTSSPGGRGSPPRRRAMRRLVGLAGLLALAVLAVAAATRPDGRLHVVILDVGQGDAILVSGPSGGRMLVDGGPDPERLLVALDARLPPWDRRLDLVVLTHPHEDHVGGLPVVLERYRVGQVAEPGMPGLGPGYEAFAARLAADGMVPVQLTSGDRFILDGVTFDVLWPDAGRVPRAPSDDGSEVNDASIVLLGSFEGRRFLLTGDAEAEVEAVLVARGLPRLDLLKAGHHGSSTSTTDALVAATRPRLAAISVGAENDYGHPSRDVLARLAEAGAVVLRTDQLGTIDVALDADGVEVRTERPLPAPPAATAGRRAQTAAGEVAATTAAASPPRAHRRPVGPLPWSEGAGRRLPYDRRDARPRWGTRPRSPALPAGRAPPSAGWAMPRSPPAGNASLPPRATEAASWLSRRSATSGATTSTASRRPRGPWAGAPPGPAARRPRGGRAEQRPARPR